MASKGLCSIELASHSKRALGGRHFVVSASAVFGFSARKQILFLSLVERTVLFHEILSVKQVTDPTLPVI
jgi:hypothetical protein